MQQDHLLSDLSVDSIASQQFGEIAKWGKFLSIISFIGCGLIVIAGVYIAYTFARLADISRELGSGYSSSYGIGMAIGYTVFAIIWFIPSLFLFQSSVKVKRGLDATDQDLFNEGLIKLKACFRFWGIMTIILLSFYLIVLFFSLLK